MCNNSAAYLFLSQLGSIFTPSGFQAGCHPPRRKAESHAFAERCRQIFRRVSPELIANHYDGAIMIEPDSGDYFIDRDREVAFQKARQKHPIAMIMEMRLNETGACGRV